MPAGTLEVFLIGATGIKDTEFFDILKGAMPQSTLTKAAKFGKGDPYAVLLCGKNEIRSNTATKQGSKPSWNQKLSFYIDDQTAELQIKIFNRNILKEDDEMGSTLIPLSKVFAEGKLPTTSYNVVRPSGRTQGEIKLSMLFIPKKKLNSQPSDSVHGPYIGKSYSSPYVKEPEPKFKHDPLRGPNGYFKNSAFDSNSASDSSHGSSNPSYKSGVGSQQSGSTRQNSSGNGTHDEGSTSSYRSYVSDAYPPVIYPPLHKTQPDTPESSNHPRDILNTSMDGSHRPMYPPREHSYPSGARYEYSANTVHHSPYEHVPHLSASSNLSELSLHYPPVSSFSHQHPHQGDMNRNGIDDVTAGVSGLGISGPSSDGSSHYYPGYRPHDLTNNNMPPSGYLTESLSGYSTYPAHLPKETIRQDYPGYPPYGCPQSESQHERPPYPPSGYSPSESSHGSHSQPGGNYPPPYNPHGPPPLSSYYPPQTLYTGPTSDQYPPISHYQSPTQYIPAGYPK